MLHDFTLAQKVAWHLARTLAAPVMLVQINDEFGVLPAGELDGADLEILVEYEPYSGGGSGC